MCRGLTCVILMVFNIILLIAGLALLIAGALLKWNKPLVLSILERSLAIEGANKPGSSTEVINMALAQIQRLADPVGNVLFIVGIILCCITILAFIGLCCRVRIALIIYAVLVAAILLAHVLVVIIYFANNSILLKPINEAFMEMIKNYESVDSNTSDSVALALIMPALQCCGYNNGADFKFYGTKFTHSDTVEGTTLSNLEYPLSCCKASSTGIDKDQCPGTFTTQNSYISIGCAKKITPIIDFIMKISIIAIAIEAITLALVIIYLCCAE